MDLIAQLQRSNLDPQVVSTLLAQLAHSEQQAQQIKTLGEQIERKSAYIKLADTKIAALTLELAHHKRMRFANKSEAFSAEQRELFQESWNSDLTAIEAELDQLAEQIGTPAKTARPTGRQPLPAHLPRIEHRHEPASCNCAKCGSELTKIGEDVSEQLDVEPARFFVHRHIRPQYACRACETISAEAIPAAVIDASLGAAGLHAWVLIQKYLDHLPLYRIEQISQRHGAGIARSTLAQWVGRLGVALQPLSDRLSELLRERTVLHADETPVPQLDPGSGKTKRAYLWAYRSSELNDNHDPPIIVFDYQPNRSGAHAQHFLKDWRGSLMVDDYIGYKKLFAENGITELGCVAHARRKFFDLHAANGSSIAAQALQHFAELYKIEREGKQFNSQARRALRQSQAQPKLEALHEWLLTIRSSSADGSGLAKAIDYSLKRWPALVRYAQSGDLPIDNNLVENAIRPICLGKNYANCSIM
jgi:transposase